MTTDYLLRTYTAGCYYLDEKFEEMLDRYYTKLDTSEQEEPPPATEDKMKKIKDKVKTPIQYL